MYFSAKNYWPLQWVIFISQSGQVNSIIQATKPNSPKIVLLYVFETVRTAW
jgi:hypothetical protein